MQGLLEGYRQFRDQNWPSYRRLFENLADFGQSPRALVIGCSDSRVDPQMIFGAKPGEIFVIRNVANLVPPYAPDANYHGTSAAIEFAVRVLKVPLIVVMGHGGCGGVRALLDGLPNLDSEFLSTWVSIARDAGKEVQDLHLDGEERQRAGEEACIRLSLDRLRSFPWVAEAVEAGTLELHGSHFDVRTGMLYVLGEDGTFAPVS